ncbi:alpha/beta fold hydrolase [Candidatus Cardinium hertigii]|uniref:Alpha/beta hydrolase n=1 Tax=Candidatus Cardinium hertigii TaxID=247481 RepID=A0A3N2QD62_9BACT|nr:alpha/beta hydrolase [Candidatus Cardinium hertigii]ROT47605.1 alpha/beta hydrolase [Candidatus Cardinium hertigii]ROT47711.1 alpha/beta hydrolase [Candidatus Cardinium hertigii]
MKIKKSPWISVFFLQTIFACSQYKQQMDPLKVATPPPVEAATAVTVTNPAFTDGQQEATFGMVLLHGLNMDTREMKALTTALSERYKENILIINSLVREDWNSVDYSIDQQAEMVYKEIVDYLQAHNKDSSSFQLFILGQSQGGVVATRIAELYKQKLNLLGFITHNAPLQGVDVLTRGPFDLLKLCNRAKKGLNIIGTKVDWDLFNLITLATSARWLCPIADCFGYKKLTGARDIFPNSSCMTAVRHYLRNNQQSDAVPGLLIGGYQNDYNRLFKHDIEQYKIEQYIEANKDRDTINEEVNQAIRKLNHDVATFLTGDADGLHDHVVPLKSQLCRGDSLEDLTHIGTQPYQIDMPGNQNITCFVIKDITHCTTLSPVAEKKINKESMMDPHRMLPVLFEFIDKKLEQARVDQSSDC